MACGSDAIEFYSKNKRLNTKHIDFTKIKNANIKNEMKYFLSEYLINEVWTPSTLASAIAPLMFIGEFLSNEYPYISSVLKIPEEELKQKYQAHMVKHNKVRNSGYTRYTSALNSFLEFLDEFVSEVPEHLKDKWRIQKLGLNYNMSRRDNFINFKNIKQPFRDYVKKFCYSNMILQRRISVATTMNILKKVYMFFNFIVETHPDWKDIQKL